MRRHLAGIAVAALAMAVQAAPAAAQEVADATCPGPTFGSQGSGPAPGAGDNRFAQTFTVQQTGTLTTVEFGVFVPGSAADWVVQILAVSGGVPVDGVLSSQTIDDATVPVTGAITAHPSPPLSVAAGQQYALTVSRPGSDTIGVATVPYDKCPGDLFFAGPAPDPFLPEGSDAEMAFTAYVTLPPKPAATTPTATADTGQRAAALKRCKKKKKRAKARKRCKKRAKKLPA